MSDEPATCSVCGSKVVVRAQRGERALGQVQGDVFEVRICTNPGCDTNGPDRALGQTP